ncbi:MAG: type IV pilus assembly protein PilM [Nitrospinae bacterium]|nr:type IV pilus assembly protein PilM [Nitrospinota bacterium]
MLRQVVGVDVGSSALKVVELRGTWKGFECVRAVERKLPVDHGTACPPEQIAQALTELLSANAIKPAGVVTAIPAQVTFVRNLQLPFRDPRKIREVLKFELEPHIPYPVEEVIVDFAKVRETEAGGCEILVVAAPKPAVAEHLRILELAGLVPEIVDWEIFGELNSYLAWRGAVTTGLVALVNLGASKTTVKILQEGRVRFTRSIARGGHALTEAIRQRLTLTTAQAEALKLSAAEHERSQITPAVEAFLGTLAKDIDHTLLAFATQADERETVRELVLQGGGARFPEAVPFFSERYGVPTMVFDADQRLFPPSPLGLYPQTAPLMPVALGLALRGVRRRAVGLDFRRGVAGALLVGLSLFDLYYQLRTKEHRYEDLQGQVETIFRDTFPDVRRSGNEIAQAREKLRELETKLKGIGTLGGLQGSSLEMLRELSVRIPQNLRVKIVDLSISIEGIGISGETNSFDGVDTLKKAFESSPYFEEVKVSQAKAGLDDKVVEFRISISLKKS